MENITQRFERVLTHIDNNLSSSLDIETLARLAQIPEYHFEFIFQSLFHTKLNEYIDLLRHLEAAQQLGFDKSVAISVVAQAVGFSSEKAFERAFTRSIGQSPKQFQLAPDWGNFFQKQQPLKTLSEGHDQLSAFEVNIEVVELEEVPLIIIEHRTLAEYLPQTIQAMRVFRQTHNLSPEKSQTFNFIYQTYPEGVEYEQIHSSASNYKIDIAVSVNAQQKASLIAAIESSEYFKETSIPKGSYASFLHSGSDEALNKKIKYLYGTWLVENSKINNTQLNTMPLIFEKLKINNSNQSQTRVYLPLFKE
ncbi:GyrI-like domain-containing protein [uncultured Shewanella sp.]|uniref:AraC family transcriptional regulator n=1 Tax=uncultured Shewanella sp. TaxID=173975 RepID=UPI002628E8F3|nr:GyrI-like domain-containing protein [uncultured Shewanella sp.]